MKPQIWDLVRRKVWPKVTGLRVLISIWELYFIVYFHQNNKLLNAKIPEGDYDTLSGFLQDELDRIPEEEENPIIETEEITYKIEEYEDKRIIKGKACKNNHIQNKEEK